MTPFTPGALVLEAPVGGFDITRPCPAECAGRIGDPCERPCDHRWRTGRISPVPILCWPGNGPTQHELYRQLGVVLIAWNQGAGSYEGGMTRAARLMGRIKTQVLMRNC